MLCRVATNMGESYSTTNTKLNTAIDNCCSYSMSNRKSDFVGALVSCNVSGANIIREYGTVKWTIEDNDGRPHDLLIPGRYYNPESPYQLLSPQHWAQTCLTTHNGMVLASTSLLFKCTTQ